MVGIPYAITYANFDDDRLGDLGLSEVKFCPSPFTLIVVHTTLSHYRTSVLSCMFNYVPVMLYA